MSDTTIAPPVELATDAAEPDAAGEERAASEEGAASEERRTGEERRARFRAALSAISTSSSADLTRWVMVPASLAVLAGFNLMLFGWLGAARTAREIEQIPYLISGGLVGLGLVLLGGLLLASAFWVAVARKMADEAEERGRAQVEVLESRLEELIAQVAAAATATATAATAASTLADAAERAETNAAGAGATGKRSASAPNGAGRTARRPAGQRSTNRRRSTT